MDAHQIADLRRQILKLLEDAGAAVIAADEQGPAWHGYAAARHTARALKKRADDLEHLLREARSKPSGRAELNWNTSPASK